MLRTTAWSCAVLLGATASGCADKASPEPVDPPATTACTPLAGPAWIGDEAVTPDGHYVAVVGSSTTTRVFYGTPGHMTEGRITNTAVGCASYLSFVVDGESYTAVFAYSSCMGNVYSRLIRGEVGGPLETQPLTLLVAIGFQTDAGAPASPLTFFCF